MGAIVAIGDTLGVGGIHPLLPGNGAGPPAILPVQFTLALSSIGLGPRLVQNIEL